MFKELFNKRNRLILLMILLLVCLGIGAILYGQYYQKQNATVFEKSGYIVNVDPSAQSTKHNFQAGEKYSLKYDGNYKFDDVSGNHVTFEPNTFLYYNDDSYTSFSNGVLLNIPDIATGNYINHYSVEPLMVVNKMNGYEIQNSDEPLILDEVLWKVNGNKYLLLSESMKVSFSDEDIRDVDDYVEINYIDAGVVQLVTKDNVWQTVSEDAKIITENGAVIYLVNEIVEFNEKQMLMSKLVLDSSENIALSPLETKTQFVPEFDITGEDGTDGESGEDGTSGENGLKADNGLNGNLGGNGSDGLSGEDGEDGVDASIDSTFNTEIPQVIFETWTIDATSFSGRYSVKNSELMDSDLSITVTEVNTNNSINVVNDDGNDKFDKSKGSFKNDTSTPLKPDTEYRMVISGVYTLNGERYNRDFITKTFYTDSLGIILEKLPSTTQSVSLKVIEKDYSQATTATVYLLNESQHLVGFKYDQVENYIDVQIPLADVNGSQEITIDKDKLKNSLKSNSTFYAYVDVVIKNGETSKNYLSQQIVQLKTLKQKPEFDFKPVASANRKDWLFELFGGTVSDPDNAVVKYIYDIYTKQVNQQTQAEEETIAKSIEVLPSNLNSATYLYIDNLSINAGVEYTFKVRAIYNDNEKNIEVSSQSSSPFIMAGTQLPAVIFRPDVDEQGNIIGVHANSISGKIIINLNNSEINLTNLNDHPIKITMKAEGIYEKTIVINDSSKVKQVGESQLEIEIYEQGLKAETMYRFDVDAFVDTDNDPNVDNFKLTNIGHVVQATPALITLTADWEKSDDANKAFEVTLKLMQKDNQKLDKDNHDIKSMEQVNINLYNANNLNQLIGRVQYNQGDSEGETNLYELFGEKGLIINEDTFNLDADDLTSDAYVIKIDGIYDYTINEDKTIDTEHEKTSKIEQYTNKYPLQVPSIEVTRTQTVPKLPDVSLINDQITATPIYNGEEIKTKYGLAYDANIPNGTIVGYEINIDFSNAARLARNIHLYAFDEVDFNGSNERASLIYDGKSLVKDTSEIVKVYETLAVSKTEVTLPKIVLAFGEGEDGSIHNGYTRLYSENLKRGHIYRFAYAIEYADDMYKDEAPNIYPYTHPEFKNLNEGDKANYILSSQSVKAPRSTPEFEMYVDSEKINDNNEKVTIVKYMYRDYDQAFGDGKNGNPYNTKISINGFEAKEIDLKAPYSNTDSKDYWHILEVPNQNTDNITFTIDWNSYESYENHAHNEQTSPIEINLPYLNDVNRNLDNINFKDLFDFSLDTENVDKNFVTFKITPKDEVAKDFYQHITQMEVVFKSSDKTSVVRLSDFNNSDTEYTIMLSRFSNVITGGEISYYPVIYYDNGFQGWSYAYSNQNTPFALQNISNENKGHYYYYNRSTQSFEMKADKTISGSAFKSNKFSEDTLKQLTHVMGSAIFEFNPINNTGLTLTMSLGANEYGIEAKDAQNNKGPYQFIPKQVVKYESSTVGTTGNIKKMIPSVSSPGKDGIDPAVQFVTLSFLDIFGANSVEKNEQGNPMVYLEICKEENPDQTGCQIQEVVLNPKTDVANNDPNRYRFEDFDIINLQPNTAYTVQMYGNMQGQKVYFLKNESTTGENWRIQIKTSDTARVEGDIKHNFVYADYNDKYMALSYELTQTKQVFVDYQILNSANEVVLNCIPNDDILDIRTNVEAKDYTKEMKDRLYIEKSWFENRKDELNQNVPPLLQYGQEYTLKFMLAQLDVNGELVRDDQGNIVYYTSDSYAPESFTFKFEEGRDPMFLGQMWVDSDFTEENNDFTLHLKLTLNDFDKVIMKEPSDVDVNNPLDYGQSYFSAKLYKVITNEDNSTSYEPIELTMVEANDDSTNKNTKFKDEILMTGQSYQFKVNVGPKETYVLKVYSPVDKNYDGYEDDNAQWHNISIENILNSETFTEEMLEKLETYVRDPYNTPDQNGISLGEQSLGIYPNDTRKIEVTYKDAVNIDMVDRISYTIIKQDTNVTYTGTIYNDIEGEESVFTQVSGGYYNLVIPQDVEPGLYWVTLMYEINEGDNSNPNYQEINRYSSEFGF